MILRCGAEAGALLVDGLGDGEQLPLPLPLPLLVSAREFVPSALNPNDSRASFVVHES